MSGVQVEDGGTVDRLERLAIFMQDLRPFWPLVVPLVTGWWRRQFDTEGEFAGQRWAPLAPAYAIAKQKRYPGRGLLVASGAMRQAVSNPSRAVTPTMLTLTIDDDKLGYHQTGTDRMPARPLVFGEPLPAQAEAELQDAADSYMADLLRRI